MIWHILLSYPNTIFFFRRHVTEPQNNSDILNNIASTIQFLYDVYCWRWSAWLTIATAAVSQMTTSNQVSSFLISPSPPPPFTTTSTVEFFIITLSLLSHHPSKKLKYSTSPLHPPPPPPIIITYCIPTNCWGIKPPPPPRCHAHQRAVQCKTWN